MKQKPIVQLIPILALVGLCIAIISLVTSLSGTIRRRNMLKLRQDALQELQEKNQELQKKLQLVQSPEFIEQEAREKLNLAKPGETVILIEQTPKETKDGQLPHLQVSNWKKWWNIFF